MNRLDIPLRKQKNNEKKIHEYLIACLILITLRKTLLLHSFSILVKKKDNAKRKKYLIRR